MCASLQTLCHIHWSDSGGLGEKLYNVHIKNPEIPYQIVLYLRLQYHARSARHLWFWGVGVGACQYIWGSFTKPLCLVLYAESRSFFPSRLSLLRVHMWSVLENAPPPVTSRTSSVLPRWELNYLSCADVTGLRGPRTDFLTGIILRAPTIGDRIFVFPNKRQGKMFSRIIFSTPPNASPVSQVTRCRNIHSA